MKINKILILVAFIIVLLLGVLLGFNIKSIQVARSQLTSILFQNLASITVRLINLAIVSLLKTDVTLVVVKTGEVMCTLMACDK